MDGLYHDCQEKFPNSVRTKPIANQGRGPHSGPYGSRRGAGSRLPGVENECEDDHPATERGCP